MWFSSHWPLQHTVGRSSYVVFLVLAAPNHVRKIFLMWFPPHWSERPNHIRKIVLMWFSSHWPLQITLGNLPNKMFLALAVPNHVGKIALMWFPSHWPLQITLGRSSECGFPRTGRSKSREEDLPNAVSLALAAPNHVRKIFLMRFSSHRPLRITLGRSS